MWTPCVTEHIWEQLSHYSGRYKCAKCYAVGYHKLVVAEALYPNGLVGPHRYQIVPYLCYKCHGPTTILNRSRPCINCRVEKPPVWKSLSGGHTLFDGTGTRLARIEFRKKIWEIKVKGVHVGTQKLAAEAKDMVENMLGIEKPAKVLPIVLEPDPRLHQVCAPVEKVTRDIIALAQDMLATMYANKGCGLAAPQVGHNIRMVVMDCSHNRDQPVVLINPEIIERSGQVEGQEGCLSFPGVQYEVKRSAQVAVTALTLSGETDTWGMTDLWSVCVQHELDHLNGVTFDKRSQLTFVPFRVDSL